MKRTSVLVSITLLSAIFFACSKTKSDPDGKWDDIIKLSGKTFALKATTDSVTVSTQGTGWWVTEVTVNGVAHLVPQDIDVESEKYRFSTDCFVVERRNAKTLFVKLSANDTAAPRVVRVGLEAGDYFDGVTVTQSAP